MAAGRGPGAPQGPEGPAGFASAVRAEGAAAVDDVRARGAGSEALRGEAGELQPLGELTSSGLASVAWPGSSGLQTGISR